MMRQLRNFIASERAQQWGLVVLGEGSVAVWLLMKWMGVQL